jgi:hypothetical protein
MALCIAVFAFLGPVSVGAIEEVVDVAVVKPKRRGPKALRLIKNILDGANMKSSKKWQAGDSRTEIAALLNSFSGVIILGTRSNMSSHTENQRSLQNCTIQERLRALLM